MADEQRFLDDPGLVQLWSAITKRLEEKLNSADQITYTLSKSGNEIKLTASSGGTQIVTLDEDSDTTYTLSITDNVLSLTPSKGDKQEVALPSILQDGGIILPSSTADSTKKFKVTVDDTGTLKATEVATET